MAEVPHLLLYQAFDVQAWLTLFTLLGNYLVKPIVLILVHKRLLTDDPVRHFHILMVNA